MRRIYAILGVSLCAVACANILGIDDGIPRNDDASVDAYVDVMVDVHDAAVDVPPEGPPFSPLSCGGSTCNFAVGEACCRTGAAKYACVDAASSCMGGTYIPCDRPEQCKGDAGPRECCTTDILTDAGTYVATSVACVASAQCSPIPTHYILCGDNDAADCPDGEGCAQSVNTLPTFYICK
jgi:hypothetical protein